MLKRPRRVFEGEISSPVIFKVVEVFGYVTIPIIFLVLL